nr:unnamed protein product [Callosobruchus chinensis]
MENQKQISKQGRITRSNSSSSASTDLACPVPANLPPPSSNLAAIMEQLSNIARDVRDIKESQSRLSNDIAQCKSLLQQHSSIIGQHETSLRVCENNIADILQPTRPYQRLTTMLLQTSYVTSYLHQKKWKNIFQI